VIHNFVISYIINGAHHHLSLVNCFIDIWHDVSYLSDDNRIDVSSQGSLIYRINFINVLISLLI